MKKSTLSALMLAPLSPALRALVFGAMLLCAWLLGIALAQTDTSPAVGIGGAGGVFAAALFPVVFTALTAGLTAALAFGSKFLKERTAAVQNERFRTILEAVGQLAYDKVAQLSQEAVRLLKEASGDGKLTAQEAQAAVTTAVKETWVSLPDDIRKLLLQIAGSEAAAKDAYVKPKVEAAVKGGAGTGVAAQSVRSINLGRAAPLPDPKAVAAARVRLGLPAQY